MKRSKVANLSGPYGGPYDAQLYFLLRCREAGMASNNLELRIGTDFRPTSPEVAGGTELMIDLYVYPDEAVDVYCQPAEQEGVAMALGLGWDGDGLSPRELTLREGPDNA